MVHGLLVLRHGMLYRIKACNVYKLNPYNDVAYYNFVSLFNGEINLIESY